MLGGGTGGFYSFTKRYSHEVLDDPVEGGPLKPEPKLLTIILFTCAERSEVLSRLGYRPLETICQLDFTVASSIALIPPGVMVKTHLPYSPITTLPIGLTPCSTSKYTCPAKISRVSEGGRRWRKWTLWVMTGPLAASADEEVTKRIVKTRAASNGKTDRRAISSEWFKRMLLLRRAVCGRKVRRTWDEARNAPNVAISRQKSPSA